MFVRKKLDIGFSQLFAGFAQCFSMKSRKSIESSVSKKWSNKEDALTAFSVRTALDAWLVTLHLPSQSEVIVCGVNIPDIKRILDYHGLKIVPVDLNMENLELKSEQLESAYTEKTRLILVVHLFGARISLDKVFDFTARHPQIQVIEDCAQAFMGIDEYRGDDRSAISLFSFGAIKTATALGGAIFRIRDVKQLKSVKHRLENYPIKSRFYFIKRVLKYTGLKILTFRYCYGVFVKLCDWTGKDFDTVIVSAVRGFNGQDLIPQLRQQLPTPQLALLNSRINRYSRSELDKRYHAGNYFNQNLPSHLRSVGYQNPHHTWWLFPVTVRDRKLLVKEMRVAGFDATATSTQLCAMEENGHKAPECKKFISQVVYLPVYSGITDSEINRMATILREHVISKSFKRNMAIAEDIQKELEFMQ